MLPANLVVALSLLLVFIAFTDLVTAFFKWYFTLSIVSDRRVVDLDFKNVVNHLFSEATLGKIEDVSHRHKGMLSSLFDYGTVFIETAGAHPNIEFDNISKPRDVQDTILDLIELRKNKII